MFVRGSEPWTTDLDRTRISSIGTRCCVTTMAQNKTDGPNDMRRSRSPSPSPDVSSASATANEVSEVSANENAAVEDAQKKFGEFLLDLFRLNSNEEACNIECDNIIRKCSLKFNNGPHTVLHMNLPTCSLFEMLFKLNFRVMRSIDTMRPRLRCAYVLKCPHCGVELFDTSSLLVMVYDRWEIMCKLMQQVSELRPTHSSLQAQNTLVNQLKFQHPTSLLYYRRQVERLLRDAHRADCSRPNNPVWPHFNNVLESVSRFNKILAELCATCFFQQLELDLRIYISVYNSRYNDDSAFVSSSVDVLCRCCFKNRAQINVPCGHIFQCDLCKLKLRESLTARMGCVVNEPPCSICRAYVITSINIYD